MILNHDEEKYVSLAGLLIKNANLILKKKIILCFRHLQAMLPKMSPFELQLVLNYEFVGFPCPKENGMVFLEVTTFLIELSIRPCDQIHNSTQSRLKIHPKIPLSSMTSKNSHFMKSYFRLIMTSGHQSPVQLSWLGPVRLHLGPDPRVYQLRLRLAPPSWSDGTM